MDRVPTMYETQRSPDAMARSKRIALLLPQDIGYGRAVLRGVQEYAVAKPHWIFRDAPPALDALKPLREWKPHGIIALLFDRDLAKALVRMRKPVVNTTSTLDLPKMPLVENDHQAIGRMAAEYFLQRGFRNFGFYGTNSSGSSKPRETSFPSVVDAAGCPVVICYHDLTL